VTVSVPSQVAVSLCMARPEPKPCKRLAHQKAWTKNFEKHWSPQVVITAQQFGQHSRIHFVGFDLGFGKICQAQILCCHMLPHLW
jgi:hypothetical protein